MNKSLGVVILAAGFGKRIKEAWDGPKGLIPYRGKPILTYLLTEVGELGVKGIVLVSNERDREGYEKLVGGGAVVISDGAREAQEARGAVVDLQLGIEELPGGDALVLPCDTLLMGTLRLTEYVGYAREKDGLTVVVRRESEGVIKGRFGNVRMGKEGRVAEFVEKPESPISPWAAAALYYYPASEVKYVSEYLASGGNPENPGRMLEYLLSIGRPVYAYQVESGMVDVGKPEELAIINGKEW